MRARRAAGTARGSASSLARLTGNLLQAKNDPPPVGQALFDRHAHCPAFAGKGQFLVESLAFEKEAKAIWHQKRCGQIEQSVERRAGARGHNMDGMPRDRLDAAWPNRNLGSGYAGRLAQKRGFSRIRLDQLDAGDAEDRQHEPGQPGAAAKVDQASRRARDETMQLRRIEDMPPP